ncbi:MAG: 4-hydroxy-tetrahydrodipicolinate reductase [Candidatus Latescibacteria bacterium]|nr:4-hydroxy-tetrahydrodipicolinate reductase [Candidatus Latescibacterota bacterium]
MINLIVVGICGKMSGSVVSAIDQEQDMQIVSGIEAVGHPLISQPIGKGFIQANLSSIIKEADVVAEFAIPEITLDNIRIAAKAKKPYIIGTTGLKDLSKIKQYADKIPILISTNFSLGVNVLFNLTQKTAQALKDFDIEIIEAHHKTKRDAPSGTAKKLAEVISIVGGNNPTVHSIRAGDIVGEHTVMFTGKGERLELIHHATSRNAFANGVIKAIRFMYKQKPGLYAMQDVLFSK